MTFLVMIGINVSAKALPIVEYRWKWAALKTV
jgi:hypothetical protein